MPLPLLVALEVPPPVPPEVDVAELCPSTAIALPVTLTGALTGT
jgi:hypothetical protein